VIVEVLFGICQAHVQGGVIFGEEELWWLSVVLSIETQDLID